MSLPIAFSHAAVGLLMAAGAVLAVPKVPIPPPSTDVPLAKQPGRETAVFAGGCLWGVQDLRPTSGWPKITGPNCARAIKRSIRSELAPRGHHDWPVKRVIRTESLITSPHIIGGASEWRWRDVVVRRRPSFDVASKTWRKRGALPLLTGPWSTR